MEVQEEVGVSVFQNRYNSRVPLNAKITFPTMQKLLLRNKTKSNVALYHTVLSVMSPHARVTTDFTALMSGQLFSEALKSQSREYCDAFRGFRYQNTW